MAWTTWGNAVSGNWADASNWADATGPASDSDVAVDVSGAFYRVVLNTAVEANSFTLSASEARFLETHDGTMTLAGAFTVWDGRAVLAGANSFGGGAAIEGGTVSVFHANGLGDGTLTMNGGHLHTIPSMALAADDLVFGGDVTIGARSHHTLTLGGGTTTIDAASTLHFGETHYHGKIVFNAGTVDAQAPYGLSLDMGRLVAGDANFSALTAGAESVNLAAHTLLSLNGFDTDVTGLTGTGIVYSGADRATLSLHGDTDFDGRIIGRVNLHVFDTATVGGYQAFRGHAEIEGAQCMLNIDGTFHNGVKFDHGGELILSEGANFTGRVWGFDGDSTIAFAGMSASTEMSYDADTHYLTLTDGDTVQSVRVMGAFSAGNFALSDNGDGGVDVTWQVATAAHPREMHHDAMPVATDWFV
jgi:autotransporter-associated beta strand protein